MSRRLEFLNHIDERARSGEWRVPDHAQRETWSAVSRALTSLTLVMPLSFAKELDQRQKEVFHSHILEVLTPREQKALAELWEPARKPIDDAAVANLRRDNLELLSGERKPYTGIHHDPQDVAEMSEREREEFQATITRIAPAKDLRAAARRWGVEVPAGANRETIARVLVSAMKSGHEASERRGKSKTSTGTEEPAPSRGRRRRAAEEPEASGDHHAWQPVKGKPGRRKRRLANGKWHYEDVPMQKAGERKAEYLLRLMRFHLGEM